MSTPSSTDPSNEGVDLGKGSEPDAPFDPYRFGHPDVPPAPEYAPPGYIPPANTAAPAYPPSAQHPEHGPPAGQPGGGYPPYPYPPGYPQQPGYGPPYGQQFGQPFGQPQAAGSNGKAVASLVLGIVSIVLCWTIYFDAVLVILAVVFGFLGLGDAKKRNGHGRAMAIAGLVCGVVGAIAAIVLTVVVVHLANKCGGLDNGNSPGFQRCVRNQI